MVGLGRRTQLPLQVPFAGSDLVGKQRKRARSSARVENFAPLWLGGHIVGFGSFFVWTLYTESDILKSDHNLLDKSDAETLTGQKK